MCKGRKAKITHENLGYMLLNSVVQIHKQQ